MQEHVKRQQHYKKQRAFPTVRVAGNAKACEVLVAPSNNPQKNTRWMDVFVLYVATLPGNVFTQHSGISNIKLDAKRKLIRWTTYAGGHTKVRQESFDQNYIYSWCLSIGISHLDDNLLVTNIAQFAELIPSSLQS